MTEISHFLCVPHVSLLLITFNLDGQSTQVEAVLYRVHRYFFCRDSNNFKDRLSRLSMQLEATPDSPPVIQLDDVKSVDFDAFLSILYPQYVYLISESTYGT